MRLKNIEIYGFKSFAEKTRVAFEPGVTAIVGPNGCGKSNFADAIKWVLGEQRPTAMRGSSMGDVIFNGTSSREPINIAEVSLTLTNEDKVLPIEYDEVTVTRRVFRTGESEYFINKTKVRLKDIQDLFHGTGVGTVSYSLIEQGKMDLILSNKPEDRRHIFEEAAGVTKYKSKKKEALNKLEHTVNNLQRVNDIINEVSRQIRSIERQARKAQRYKERWDKLKNLEVKLAYRNYQNLKKDNDESAGRHNDLKRQEDGIIAVINELDSKADVDRNKLHAIDDNFSSLQTEKINLSGTIESNLSKIEMNKERIKELEDKLAGLENQEKSFKTKLESLKTQIETANLQVEEIQQSKSKKYELISQNEARLEELNSTIAESDKIIKENKAKIIDVASKITQFNNSISEIKANIQNVNSRLKRLRLEREETEAEKALSEEKEKQLSEECDVVKSSIAQIRETFNTSCRQLAEAEEQLGAIKFALDELNHKYAACNSKLKFLIDLKERYEGYSKSVKNLLIYASQKRLPFEGLHDSLANLIDVEDGFEIAVEAFLSGLTQAVVVNDVACAQEAVEYLKANDLGWVKFIPLKSFKKEPEALKFGGSEKTLGLLSEKVSVPAQYEMMIAGLLKDAYIVEDSQQAHKLYNALSDEQKTRVSFITRDAQIVGRRAVSGGSYKMLEESSLIGRDAKISKLNTQKQSLQGQLQDCKQGMQLIEDIIAGLQDIKEELQKRLHNEEIKMTNIDSDLNASKEEIRKFNDELMLVDTEIEESEEERSKLLTKQAESEAELAGTEEENARLENLIQEHQQNIESAKQQIQDALVKITEIKTELSSIDDVLNNKKETLGMLAGSVDEVKADTEKLKEDRENAGKRISQLTQEIETLKEMNEQFSGKAGSLSDKINEVNSQRQVLIDKIKEQDSVIRKKQEELTQLREGLHKFEVRTTEYGLRVDNLKERIQNAYRVNIEEADIALDENTDWNQVKREIDHFKKKLEKIGNVNLVAIDEHEDLKERFEFLTVQRQDLEDARDQLHKAIQKINRTTTRVFKETFEQIRVTFEEFFKLLFGGGKAELLLVDERNVLESGIEIIARPPGKKLQNISLLSGGERALTAIALLFAVFKVKPSPFCVLDEIDAPLDESNVVRFSKVLADFVKTSQFIIITHNKKTIGMADVMYGITMEESGISKVVSVKFIDDKKQEPAGVS